METGLGRIMRLYFSQYQGKKVKRCFTSVNFFSDDSDQKKKQNYPKLLSVEYKSTGTRTDSHKLKYKKHAWLPAQ